jgi:hypothetical protein
MLPRTVFLCASAVLCVISISAIGCRPAAQQADSAPRAGNARDNNRQVLQSIIQSLQPGQIGMSASVEDQLPLLTEWRKSSGDEEIAPHSLPDELATLLAPDTQADLESVQFSSSDLVHLRDCALSRTQARRFDAATGSEADRVTAICRYVSRTICLSKELIEAGDTVPPRSIFGSFLFGEGTPADRAVAVASLARELKLDTALLLPPTNASPASETAAVDSLVLIIDGRSVFVFDPLLAQLITSPNHPNPWKRTAATLAEILADESLLRQYDAPGREYAWTVERIKASYLSPIGNASLWSARMARLQSQLTGDDSLAASDPLGDSGESPGAWSRIRTAVKDHLPAVKPFVWNLPQRQLAAGSLRSSAATPRLEGRVNVLNLRFTVGEGDQEQKRIARFERSLLRGRLAELSGETGEAIGRYTEARTTYLVAPPSAGGTIAGGPVVDETQARDYLLEAKDAAEFWTIQCQFDNEELALAATAAEYYLRNRSKTGKWTVPARLLLSEARGRLDKLVSPIRILQGIAELEPQYMEASWLVRNLEAATKKPVDPAPMDAEEPSESEAGDTAPENTATEPNESGAPNAEDAGDDASEKSAPPEEAAEVLPDDNPQAEASPPEPTPPEEKPAEGESTGDLPRP